MSNVRLLLIGVPGSEFRLAAELARRAGADVALIDSVAEGADYLRGSGADLVMIDVALDVRAFIGQLRSERMAVPVIACGIDAPAQVAVAAIRAGARDYVPLPPEPALIAAAITSVALRAPRLPSVDPVFARIEQLAIFLAPDAKPILIEGERGSGRETLARAIHDASGRAGRFLAVDCAGPSAEVVESELFGHEAGTFPGAIARRSGAIDQAEGGTLFLRAVEALPAELKTRLAEASLRGVRVIGCSAAPGLAELGGATRITLPPLRKRAADIAPLAQHLARHFSANEGGPLRSFDDRAIALLEAQSWSGNVAELEQVVHRAVISRPVETIRADDLPLAAEPAPAGLDVAPLVGQTVEDVERELILHTLEHCHGNRTSASNILGISVRTMRNKLRAFIEAGIPVAPAP
jgi:DNA-binding NtrC family response regulator